PDVLRLDDLPLPEPGPGQARVRIEAVGVNFIDTYERAGLYKRPLPLTLGSEAAGVVDARGPDVRDVGVGQRVPFVSIPAASAEYALAPADRLVSIPDGMETHIAAAALLQGLTAHYLVYSTYPLDSSKTALVHAAAGGVGHLLVQIAKKRGARVIGTVGSE